MMEDGYRLHGADGSGHLGWIINPIVDDLKSGTPQFPTIETETQDT